MNQLNETLKEILNFLLYPKFEGPLLILKIIFLIFGFFFLGFVVWALIFTSWMKKAFLLDLKEFLLYKPYFVKTLLPKWKKIKKRLERGIEAEDKLAILEADSLLEEFLKKEGYPGETLDEKLEKLTKEIISNIEELREVRKVRMAIIEDPSYKLSHEEALRVISVYEKALKDLQAI